MFLSFGYRMPLADRARLVRAAGFDTAMAWWGPEDELFRTGRRAMIPEVVQGAGLFLENVHVPFDTCNDLWSEDKSVREAIIGQYTEWLDDCARFAIPAMVIHVTKGRPSPPNSFGIESVTRIIEAAEERGVVVAVENTRSIEHLRLVFSEIDSPSLGFCYDSSHDRLHSPEMTLPLREFGARLVATHFSDNDGSVDHHWLPGEGVIDWETVAASFPVDYTGSICLEAFSRRKTGRPGAEEFLATAYEKALWLSEKLVRIGQDEVR